MEKSVCKFVLSILLATVCAIFAEGQDAPEAQTGEKRIIPQFDFRQVDSLVDDAMNKILASDSQATVVTGVRWYVGSYSGPTEQYSAYGNHFDIFIFNITDQKCSVQKIDNFGYFQAGKLDASKILDFLNSHWNEMQPEILNPKIDTVYGADGRASTSQTHIDHQLVKKLKVARGGKILSYVYPADYSDNKYNLLTYRYKFLELLGEFQKRVDRKKYSRTGVTYGYYHPLGY